MSTVFPIPCRVTYLEQEGHFSEVTVVLQPGWKLHILCTGVEFEHTIPRSPRITSTHAQSVTFASHYRTSALKMLHRTLKFVNKHLHMVIMAGFLTALTWHTPCFSWQIWWQYWLDNIVSTCSTNICTTSLSPAPFWFAVCSRQIGDCRPRWNLTHDLFASRRSRLRSIWKNLVCFVRGTYNRTWPWSGIQTHGPYLLWTSLFMKLCKAKAKLAIYCLF